MLAEAHITMKAVDGARNLFRVWSLDVNRDLFGELTVSITFGRIGTQGRTVITHCTNEMEVRALVRRALARRATAPERLGVDYRTISSAGLDRWK